MKFIWYNYPTGGLAFKLGNDVIVYNIKFAAGIMTKKRFFGYLSFLPARSYNELEQLEVKE